MNFEDNCQVKGCNQKASKLGTNDTGSIIEMCGNCWHNKYKQ
jgi:hypothetical protein